MEVYYKREPASRFAALTDFDIRLYGWLILIAVVAGVLFTH